MVHCIEEFLPGSAPSLLSPAPSPSSSDAPVITGFDISLLPPPARPSPRCVLHLPSFLVSVPLGAGVLLCYFTGSLIPLVPLQLRRQLFNLLHDVAHPGVPASWRPVSSKFVLPGLFLETWALGQGLVSFVNRVKFQLKFILQFQPFLSP